MKSLLSFLAVSTAAVTATTYYNLDPNWPTGIAGLNVSSITAVAITNTQQFGTEIHVAQRGTAVPFILVFAPNGTLTRTWGKNLTSPHGLYSPGDNTVWVADIGEATVKEYDILTEELLSLIGDPHHPGNGVNPPAFSAPADIALTTSKYVLTSDGDGGTDNRVLDMTPPGAGLGPWNVYYGVGGNGTGPGQFMSPHSIAYQYKTKQFWVANRGNSRIDLFDAETGYYLGSWDGPSCFNGIPWGIRLNEEKGHMLVADGNNGNMYVLSLPNQVSSMYRSTKTTLRGTKKGSSSSTRNTLQAIAPCQLLQNISIGVSRKPHELAIDPSTGDVYLAGVGTPPTIQRYVPV